MRVRARVFSDIVVAVSCVLDASTMAAPASTAAAATIEGVVTLPPTIAAPVANPRYPTAANYTVGTPDPPAAVVYLEGDFPMSSAAAPVAEMAQHAYQFAPGLLAIRTGSVVRFPNRDDEYHSVFS